MITTKFQRSSVFQWQRPPLVGAIVDRVRRGPAAGFAAAADAAADSADGAAAAVDLNATTAPSQLSPETW